MNYNNRVHLIAGTIYSTVIFSKEILFVLIIKSISCLHFKVLAYRSVFIIIIISQLQSTASIGLSNCTLLSSILGQDLIWTRIYIDQTLTERQKTHEKNLQSKCVYQHQKRSSTANNYRKKLRCSDNNQYYIAETDEHACTIE